MMKKMYKYFLCLVAAVCFLTGCSVITGTSEERDAMNESSKKTSVAIIISGHGNSMKIDPSTDRVEKILMDVAVTDGNIIIVSSEGVPRIIYNGRIMGEDHIDEAWSEKKKSKHYKEAVKTVKSYFTSVEAVSEGVNTLKAIQIAAAALKDCFSEDKYLVMADTGLSTEVPMDFRDGILWADTKEYIDTLEAHCSLPVMIDIQVICYGLGQTASPQKNLADEDIAKLKEIYRELFMRSGASIVDISDYPFTDTVDNRLPTVPEVNVRDEIRESYTLPESENDEIQINMGEDSLYFKPNDYTFIDSAQAEDVLRPIAESLVLQPDKKILLVGCTASGNKEFCQKLSDNRSQACKQLLMKLGAKENQIVAIGMSFDNPWHEPDLDTNGKLTKNATKNHRIVIMNYTSDKAASIIDGTWR